MNNRWQELKSGLGPIQFLELAHYSHLALHTGVNGGDRLDPFAPALILQHDNGGCQTGCYRYISRGVQLWHTEEDANRKSGIQIDQPRVATFQLDLGMSVDTADMLEYL
jgi:hypothetical protein